MAYQNIEFVCAGNNGRSPVAEAAAKALVRSIGLKHMTISSSGTMVDISGVTDFKRLMTLYVESAIKRGVVPQDRMQKLIEDPMAVFNELSAIEEGWRNRYIAEAITPGYGPHVRRQTVIRPETQLILAVHESVLGRVEEIYASPGTGRKPRMEVLPDYAGLKLDLNDVEGIRDYRGYKDLADKVAQCAREAVVRAVKD